MVRFGNTLFSVDETQSGMVLRPYQSEIVGNCISSLEYNRSVLVVCPTGTGKSVALAQLAYEFSHKGKVLVLAHTIDLVHQLAGEIKNVTGSWPEIERSEHFVDFADFNRCAYIVSTIQTQYSGKDTMRCQRFGVEEFVLVICDEAHNFINASSTKVIEYYERNPNCKFAYFTATPDRTDNVSLSRHCDVVAYNGQLKDFIDQGWLVRPRVKMVHLEDYDISNVGLTKGDLNAKQLQQAMTKEELIAAMAEKIYENTTDMKTIIFCPGVTFAELMRDHLNSYKDGSAACVFGHTNKDERKRVIDEFKKGDLQYFVNVNVATEGFNCREIKCVVDCSPTKSRNRVVQRIGRGLRTLDGVVEGIDNYLERLEAIQESDKIDCLILDFYGNSGRHKLVSAVDVLAGEEYCQEAIDKVKEKIKESGQAVLDIDGELADAEREVKNNRQQKMSELCDLIREGKLELRVRASYDTIDAFSLWQLPNDNYTHQAVKGRLATKEQCLLLKKYNIATENLTFDQAKVAVAECMKLAAIPTGKQMTQVRKMGIPYELHQKITRKNAGRLMGLWKDSGFKPYPYWKQRAGLE